MGCAKGPVVYSNSTIPPQFPSSLSSSVNLSPLLEPKLLFADFSLFSFD